MGQSLNSMIHHPLHQQKSKDELLFQCVSTGNVDAIKALHLQGANLEWIDGEGKTPLIVACMDSGLINVANTLIELGANVNAYRPGRHAGTPLHHAAKRGLEPTVGLLLSHGANALVRNDDCHTPLDVARIKGHTIVVRTIESHISYFSGWLRELYGPGFLEALAPQLLSKKIWAVVIPCGSGNPTKPHRFELAMYPTLQDAQPCTVINLWNAKVDEPKFHQRDPALTIFDKSTSIRYKLASANEGGKQQLQWLYNACRGIPQVMPSTVSHSSAPSIPMSAHQTTEATKPGIANGHQKAEAINANGWDNPMSSDAHNGWGLASHSGTSCSGWTGEPAKEEYNGWDVPDSGPNSQVVQTHTNPAPSVDTSSGISTSVPSAPPLPEEMSNEGPIHYPSVESSPVRLYTSPVEAAVL
ncbi:probable E3 ubiquitin-protein ligase XBOS34 isoform X2 [Mangifera indica]|uniref:probable E3 ubiquitin-protein ligase XBOS34 isoform X2 n=1 Tax=Mangifera indica TaxID=29780 RepID=UPI001CF98AE9|nr:probable E3 ubiquitin-protein ligase XBOS34 isoform X2 [Mangifera indica]